MMLFGCVECLLWFCYFGQEVCTAFHSLSEFIYMLDWQSFPIQIQRHILLIMQYAQKPVYIRGFGRFGRIYWSLEIFKEVKFNDYMSIDSKCQSNCIF